MEMIDISKIKEKNDSSQTKKLLKIYQEGHLNKTNVLLLYYFNYFNCIYCIYYNNMEYFLKILFFIIFFIFLKHNPKNYDKKKKKYHVYSVINYSSNLRYINSTKEKDLIFLNVNE